MRAVITGGAGFLGSHLCDALVARGDTVVCVDNLVTGRVANISHLLGNPSFQFQESDVIDGLSITGDIDVVAHLASPASPPAHMYHPLKMLRVSSQGTTNALDLAQEHGARFVLASTSEVYGDPVVHPQHEDYWGNVNPIGPRSPYNEGKRYAEALTAAYHRTHDTRTGIVRIFNTYGPRMSAGGGGIVSNFIVQALASDPLTVYGDGSQTRSLCYVDDLIYGFVAMIDSSEPGPMNLGNPEELSVIAIAKLVLRLTRSASTIKHMPLPEDDPARRCPVITRAQELLRWQPEISAEEGVRRTVEWLRSHVGEFSEKHNKNT